MANKKQKQEPSSDERNVVGAEQVNVHDLEDQLYLIWQKNKGLIIGGIGAIFVLFFGSQGLNYMQTASQESQRESYQAADSAQAKAAFAQAESGEPLAGLAEKELGDAAYQDSNFSQAEEHYRKAATSAETAIKEAATLGLAMAQQAQGKTDAARTTLQSLADNEDAANSAEAQYRLALLAKEEGDVETARSLIEAIPDESQFWKARARSLERELPARDA